MKKNTIEIESVLSCKRVVNISLAALPNVFKCMYMEFYLINPTEITYRIEKDKDKKYFISTDIEEAIKQYNEI